MNKTILLFIVLSCCAVFSYAGDIQKVGFPEYTDKVKSLNSACQIKGMPTFSGFCLSSEYGKATYNNPVQTSITMGLEIACFEYFYKNCEHTENPSVDVTILKAKGVLDAGKFFEEMKVQKEATANYTGQFYYCKSKAENDATISNRLKWFDYMISKFSINGESEKSQPSKVVTSNKPAKSVVDCILSKYQGTGNDFFATGVLGQDGSIVVILFAPNQLPLAVVKNMDDGSITQYANTEFDKYKSIPKSKDFTNAVINCQ